ncbi:MAG: lectin like domain-containing protein [Bacilli bacterium]|nr:lectin like domain-containing protein [Bacilli bacterium]MDD4407170.1 lectin like domain-containing protein [Bacilli bacterium]
MKRVRLNSKNIIFLGILILSVTFSSGKLINNFFINKTNVKSYSTKGALEPILGNVNPEFEAWLDISFKEKKEGLSPVPYVIENNPSKFSRFKLNIDDVSASISDPTFDLRNDDGVNNVTSVKNQMNTNWCSWFQANAMIESTILKKYQSEYDFSERYNRYATVRYFLNDELNPLGFNEDATKGANYFKTSALLSSRRGPINEIDMPFVNNMDLINISEIQNKNTTAYVENIKFFPSYASKDTEMINNMKQHLINYGALGVGYYHDDNYYNALTGAYYYLGDFKSLNHGVTVVGWDDNYSSTNFKTNYQPPNNGAWIIKNSWGTSWGNSGYVYISYDDYRIYNQVYGITEVSITKDYDNSYYYDPLGWSGGFGYKTDNPVYVANKYTKKTDGLELLSEITIGTLGVTNYELYINSIDSNLVSSNMKLIKSGNLGYAGYHTIKLDEPILLENSNFSVMVSYQVNGNQYPVPLQTSFESLEAYNYDGYEANQSFTSYDKTNWYDLYDKAEQSAGSIKAFTQTIAYDFTLGDIIKEPSIIYDKKGGKLTLPINSSYITDSSLFNVKITNSDNIDVTNQFTITKTEIKNNTSNIILEFIGPLNAGNYNIEVNYDYITKNKTVTLNEFIDISDISVSENTINIKKGNIYNVDFNILPTNASNKTLNWSSNNTDVATVDSSGNITAISTGEAIITVSSTDGTNINKTININVIDYQYTTDYNIGDNYLSNVAKETILETFINNFQLTGVTIKVTDKNNNEVTSGYIGTGMKLDILYNLNSVEAYDIVITGDTNGDGLIRSIDLSQMRFHLAGVSGYTKENAYLKALDINKNGAVTSIDLSQLRLLIANG